MDLRRFILVGTVSVSMGSSCCFATIPYGSVTPGIPVLGPTAAPPTIVTGKEYSHDRDHIATAAGVAFDAQHVVPWDGSGGVGIGGPSFHGHPPQLHA